MPTFRRLQFKAEHKCQHLNDCNSKPNTSTNIQTTAIRSRTQIPSPEQSESNTNAYTLHRKWKSHPSSNAQNDCNFCRNTNIALTFIVIQNRTYDNYCGPIETHIHEHRILSRNTEKPKLIIEEYFCIVSILDWGIPFTEFNPARRFWRICYVPLIKKVRFLTWLNCLI
jgi:hypothetical protein